MIHFVIVNQLQGCYFTTGADWSSLASRYLEYHDDDDDNHAILLWQNLSQCLVLNVNTSLFIDRFGKGRLRRSLLYSLSLDSSMRRSLNIATTQMNILLQVMMIMMTMIMMNYRLS